MRFYELILWDKSNKLFRFAAMGSAAPDVSLTSHIGDRWLPGAAQFDFEIMRAGNAYRPATMPDSWIRIWGISLEEISQAADLQGFKVQLRGGLKKGLPLAKPEQIAILGSGVVNKPFGNWIGNEMTLEFVIHWSEESQQLDLKPLNIVWRWPANSSLKASIEDALRVPFPDAKIDIRIADDQLKLDNDENDLASNITQFAQQVRDRTRHPKFKKIPTLSGGDYEGVTVDPPHNKVIRVYDGTQPDDQRKGGSLSNPIEIMGNELIGQPTWVGPYTITVTCPLRGDISPGDFIKLPDNLRVPFAITHPNAAYPGTASRFSSTFKGTFTVTGVRHIGSSRQSNAAAWATTITAFSKNFEVSRAKTETAQATNLPPPVSQDTRQNP